MFLAGLKPELEKDSSWGFFVFPFLITRLLSKAHMQHQPSAKTVFSKKHEVSYKKILIYYSILQEFLHFISFFIKMKGNILSCTTLPASLKHQNWSLLCPVMFNEMTMVKPLSVVTFPRLPLSMCLHMTPPEGSFLLENIA